MPPVAINSCNVNLPKGPGLDDSAAEDLLNNPNTRDYLAGQGTYRQTVLRFAAD
jgi:hypothetical protein